MFHRRFSLALVVLAVGSSALSGQDKDKPPADPKADAAGAEKYYPLKVGTKWTYSSGGNQFTTEVVKLEKVDDTLCAKVEATANGMVVATEHLHVGAEGV